MVLNKGAQATQSEMLFSTEEEKWEMKIDTNSISHIIARLTDLYENPIEATVRELISNAIDTTKRLPEEMRQEIVVTLPNELNREFIVTDLGEGMSYQVIKEIYSQYGASTKSTDMSQIGAYGLGAKAPLSYCSQFTVESTRDGFTTEILISSEMSGNYIRTVSAEQTGRPNGTKVVIPVREVDSSEFVKAAKSYHSFGLETEIKFIGHDYGERDNLIYIGNSLVDTDSDGTKIEVRVFMGVETPGDVLYNYLNDNISDSPDYLLSGWKYSGNARYSYRRTIPMYVELIPGLVDFSSSRDSITRNHRFTHVNDVINEDKKRFISEYIQNAIQNGDLSERDCLAQIGKVVSRYNINNHRFGEYIKQLKSKDDEIFFDKVISQDGDEFIALFARDFYSKLTTISKFRNDSFAGESIKMTELRTAIDENESTVPINSLISFAPNGDGNLLIVTEFEDEVTARKAISRTNAYYQNKSGSSNIQFGFTYLDKDSLIQSAEGLYDLTKATFMTYEKFMDFTKPQKKVASANTSPEEILVRANSTVIDSLETALGSGYSYSFDNPYVKRKDTIEAIEGYKVLIVKDNMNSYLPYYSSGISKALFNIKSKHLEGKVTAYFITATNITTNNVDLLISEFDEIVIAEDVKYRSKMVAEKIEAKGWSKVPDKYIVDTTSKFGQQLQMVPARETLRLITRFIECEFISTPKNLDKVFMTEVDEYFNNYKLARLEIDSEEIEFINENETTPTTKKLEKIQKYYSENSILINELGYVVEDINKKEVAPTGLLATFVNEMLNLVTV